MYRLATRASHQTPEIASTAPIILDAANVMSTFTNRVRTGRVKVEDTDYVRLRDQPNLFDEAFSMPHARRRNLKIPLLAPMTGRRTADLYVKKGKTSIIR